ncbi:MAG: glycosyltransferase family A protein [Simkaniaceae bacterium]
MKKASVFLFLIAALVSTFYGVRKHFSQITHRQIGKEEEIQKGLATFYPLLEDQMIVALVIAENGEKDVERNLRSLFDQTYPHVRILYIDNGSTDKTYEKAQQWVQDRGKQSAITFIKKEEKRPLLEILYEVIGGCDPHDVIALLDGKDWLSHENVFEHLNCAYANPDVWMTYSRFISHPDYKDVKGRVFSDAILKEKKLRKEVREELSPFLTFYAGFFQEIKLQDLLYQGSFIDEAWRLALELPLVEMGPEHVLFMDEVSYVKNEREKNFDHKLHLQKLAATQSHLRSQKVYPKLSALKLRANFPKQHRYKSDVILFSEDSPLHLYACLESIFLKVRDINEIYVLYKGSDQEFERAYLNLQNEFQNVQFLNVCDYPGNDFSSLITQVLSNRRHSSPYVMIGEDLMIFEESIRMHDCIEALEKTHADHFFLGVEEEVAPLPHAIAISPGIYAWQLGTEGSHKGFTLTLCRKSLFETLENTKDFPAFKQFWKGKLTPEAVALFFEEKKTLPMKFQTEASSAVKKKWGHQFIEGFKIDLPSLTCEMDEMEKGELPLIKREKKRITHKQE